MSGSEVGDSIPRWFWLVAFAIIAIVLAYPLLLPKLLSTDLNKTGYFGDIYGAVNALFSGFAFLGIVYAIFIQRQELALQRIELRQTRKELEGQREQLAAQSKSWEQQNFENAYFQLIGLLTNYVGGMRESHDQRWYEGRAAFVALQAHLGMHWQGSKGATLDEHLLNAVRAFYQNYGHSVSPYLHILISLLRFVRDSKGIAADEKAFYFELIGNQLSNPELKVIFYSVAKIDEFSAHRELIDEMGILKRIRRDTLFQGDHAKLYKSTSG